MIVGAGICHWQVADEPNSKGTLCLSSLEQFARPLSLFLQDRSEGTSKQVGPVFPKWPLSVRLLLWTCRCLGKGKKPMKCCHRDNQSSTHTPLFSVCNYTPKLYTYQGMLIRGLTTHISIVAHTYWSILVVVDTLRGKHKPPVQPVPSDVSLFPQETNFQDFSLLLSQQLACEWPLPQRHPDVLCLPLSCATLSPVSPSPFPCSCLYSSLRLLDTCIKIMTLDLPRKKFAVGYLQFYNT